MLSNVKLTKLNMLKHLGINLANASFCASKIKETRISLIMTCKQICISALAKCKPCYADNIINKNAMTEEIISKNTVSSHLMCILAKIGINKKKLSRTVSSGCKALACAPDIGYKYKGNSDLLDKNYSVGIN